MIINGNKLMFSKEIVVACFKTSRYSILDKGHSQNCIIRIADNRPIAEHVTS